MRRVRTATDGGFTIIEVMVAVLILSVGLLGLLASLDVFRGSTTQSIARQAATHEAQRQLEDLRALGYKRLVLSAAPGSPSGPRDPRGGISGSAYRPSPTAVLAPLVIDATAEGALAPSVPWSSGRVAGTVYRFITQEAAGTPGCGQICPKRVSVGVTYTVDGVLHAVVMSTLVADPQAGTADETTAQTPKPAQCPCWTTLFLYDTPGSFVERQTQTGDHLLHARNDTPDLMGQDPPPNPYENAATPPTEPPRYRYGTDLEASDGLGLTYPAGALVKPSGGCNDDGDKKKTARWTTKPVLQNTVLHGNATASIWSQLAGTLTGKGSLCFTFYDWTIDGNTGKIKAGKVKLLSSGFWQDPWPTGAPDQISTDVFRYLTAGTTRTLVAGHALGVEITVSDQGSGTEALFYDHPAFQSSIQIDSTPALP